MIRHNLLLIYRSFKRFRSTFIINLVGLATGLTCVVLIYLWVSDELSIDKFFDNSDRIYQVLQNTKRDGGIQTGAGTAGLLVKAIEDEFPEVEQAAAYVPADTYGRQMIVTIGDRKLLANTMYASPSFFDVFSYTVVAGDKGTALNDRRSVVVTESMAMKLFNTTDGVLGKTIGSSEDQKTEVFNISAVVKDPPPNATNQFDIILNYDFFLDRHDWLKTWTSSDPLTFVKLRADASAEAFQGKISGLVRQKDPKSEISLMIQNASDRYLYGSYENGKSVGGRIQYVRLFVSIAALILLIASINYMNLTTAKASRRIKDVGIKKAIGANRSTLAWLYIGESLVMTFLSMAIALLMADLLLSPFNTLTGKELSLNFDVRFVLAIVAITVLTGSVAGTYPAFYLSKFNPAAILKGKLNIAFGEVWARKGLVVFQFSISIVLIVAVIILYQQIDYIQSKNLGYQRDHVIHFETEKMSDAFMAELKAIPGVVNAGRFYHTLTGRHGETGAVDWEGRNPDEYVNFSNLEMGYDLVETMGFEMAEGKSFDRSFGSVDQVIFNEAAIKAMGLKDPVGRRVQIWDFKREIVGVVKNFNLESMYSEVKPCMLFLVPMIDDVPSTVMVRLEPASDREAIERIKDFYQKYNPQFPFDFQFVDEDYQRMYSAELRVSALSKYFAGVAIIISCLGVFALAAFTAERRLKEIGIRKVLGSSNASIVYLLSAEFTRMVVIAIVISLPVSFLIVKQWLDQFAFRIPLQISYFIIAAMAALLLTWITVGIQATKAARVNPVKCLKDE